MFAGRNPLVESHHAGKRKMLPPGQLLTYYLVVSLRNTSYTMNNLDQLSGEFVQDREDLPDGSVEIRLQVGLDIHCVPSPSFLTTYLTIIVLLSVAHRVYIFMAPA